MTQLELTSLENDFLKELANVGAGHASGALSQIIQDEIKIGVSNIKLMSLNNKITKEDKNIVAIYSDILSSEMTGHLVLTISNETSKKILEIINNKEEEIFTAMGLAIFHSYSEAVNNLLSINLLYSPSKVIKGNTKTIMQKIAKKKEGEYAIIIANDFKGINKNINGEFEMTLIPNELNLLLEKIKNKMMLS